MIELALLKNFFIALALGTLIGLEREYAHFRRVGHTYAGIRTFPLISLFGAVAAFLGEQISLWVLYLAMLLMGVLIIIAYFTISKQHTTQKSATTEVAGFLAFFIGMLSYYGEFSFAILLTIIITSILYARSLLHSFAQKMTQQEMVTTILFAIIAFVVLPLLPNHWYGPHQLFNPYIAWLMVVFISGISFLGYALMKWFGEKGVGLAGLLGGLVSSTAVTMSFTEKSKKELKLYRTLALGVILANGVMFIRVLVEVFVINQSLFLQLLPRLSLLAAVTALFSYLYGKKAHQVKIKVELKSPFRLLPAVKFALFFAFILAVVKLADVYLSTRGVYIVSILSGFADVDALTLSLSQLAKTSLAEVTARNAIIMGVLTNIAVKGGIAYWLGGKEYGKIVLSFFAVLIVLGLGLLLI